MPVKEHYEHLHQAAGGVVGASFGEGRADLMAKAHAFVADLEQWVAIVDRRKEAVALQIASREYQFALMALSFGSYRSAFSALRLFLELTFASIRWSVNEQELREWLRSERDLNWTALIDKESGVLSKRVLRLFSDLFADEAAAYRASAEAVYRECSQFIHGNAASNTVLPPTLQFDPGAFTLWHDKASVTRLVVIFVLASRYLSDLSKAERTSLEHGLLDILGHSPAVRQLLGAPVEAGNG
jgi:hypothetical protein